MLDRRKHSRNETFSGSSAIDQVCHVSMGRYLRERFGKSTIMLLLVIFFSTDKTLSNSFLSAETQRSWQSLRQNVAQLISYNNAFCIVYSDI